MSQDPASNPGASQPPAGHAAWVVPLCWSAVALEGFDLVVLGVVLPTLLRGEDWGLDPTSASVISAVGLVGVMLGALAIGAVTDLLGRRRTMLATVVGFSVLTLLCAFAPNAWIFGLLRFLAGLGLGGVLPTALALVGDHARSGRGGSATTTMMTGYHVGAVLTSLLGILVIPALGWRPMFVVAALPALVLVPLMVRYLPESATFLRSRQVSRQVEATAAGARDAQSHPVAPRNPARTLFRGGYLRVTLAFWAASFMGLLLVYGLNTWLPEIMRAAGYELGASLSLLLVLNVGAVLGLLLAGRVADRVGPRRSSIAWFAASVLFLALLSIKLPGIGVHIGVLLAGIFVFSAQVLVYAYVAERYPVASRGTALGAASGIGRLGAISGPMIGGVLLSAGLAYPWGFYLFAGVAAVGAVSVSLVGPAARGTGPREHVEQPS